MNQENHPDRYDACRFLSRVHDIVDFWHERPLLPDLGTDPLRARLLRFAADMISLTDSAEGHGWDIRDIAYRLNEERDVDAVVAIPKEELEERFDDAIRKCYRDDNSDDEQPDGDRGAEVTPL